MRDLFLQALRCEPVPRPPVWLMRQAGRYMPEYRALREKHTLWQMFHDPKVAAEVTRLPLQLLDVDAAILFSDILVITEALGHAVQFPDKGGPRIEPPVVSADLPYIPNSLSYVFETIDLLKGTIDVPLIGFCGGPFTVASYMIDSTSKNAFEKTKQWLKNDPESFHQLLQKITDATILYLKGQVKAGVDALQVFDSWANTLNDEEFAAFCLPYLKQIVEALKGTPVILFCRGSSLRAKELVSLEAACISFDWHQPMRALRDQVPGHIAVQGNFNPEFLKQTPEKITEDVQELLSSMEGETGFIVNLGHGVTPDIPFENVRHFVNEVATNKHFSL